MEVRPDVTTHAIDWSYGDYEEPLSIHVATPEDVTVMIGGGDDAIESEVVSVAREHGVEAVVVEHAHVDHYGAVPALRDSMDVTVAVPKDDSAALRRVGIEPDVELVEGEPRWGIEPIATPGHTPGNMAYRAGDVLFAGDTVVGSDSVFAAEEEWTGSLAVIEPRFNHDDDRTRRSVERLRDLEIETVLVSHGSHVRDDATAAIEALLEDVR
ncbi:MAG: MBL fold metallo-hydrolase [Halapricum sp.]